MDIFVKRSDKVTVDVYAWELDDNVGASDEATDAPKNVDKVEIIKFTFRKPTNADSLKIIGASGVSDDGFADPMAFQQEALRTLLVGIVKDQEQINVKMRDINNLHPNIARAAFAGLLEKISI